MSPLYQRVFDWSLLYWNYKKEENPAPAHTSTLLIWCDDGRYAHGRWMLFGAVAGNNVIIDFWCDRWYQRAESWNAARCAAEQPLYHQQRTGLLAVIIWHIRLELVSKTVVCCLVDDGFILIDGQRARIDVSGPSGGSDPYRYWYQAVPFIGQQEKKGYGGVQGDGDLWIWKQTAFNQRGEKSKNGWCISRTARWKPEDTIFTPAKLPLLVCVINAFCCRCWTWWLSLRKWWLWLRHWYPP